MSEKSKASTLAALALAGVVAVTAPGPASSQDAQPQATTTLTQANTQQTQGIRYMDVTARRDGWAVAQGLGVSGSNNRKIVIVSYSDPGTTRAFYDLAQQFAQPPQNLPIFGVVRAPAHPTNPNQLGYEVYFNGLPVPTEASPDTSFTRQQHLAASIRSIGRVHFSAAAITDNETDSPVVAMSGGGKSNMVAAVAGKASSSSGTVGGSGTGGNGSGGAGAAGGGDTGGAAGGKGSTEVAAIVFNNDL